MSKSIDRERLAAYGVPSQLVDAFGRMSERGAFDEEAPEGLLARTLEACLAQVAKTETFPLVFPMRRYRRNIDPVVINGYYQADPPMVCLRHHGLGHLGIWGSNEFAGMRAVRNRLTEGEGAAPLEIEVLRDPATYTAEDGEMLWRQYREDPCDISWVPDRQVAELGIRDIVVAEPLGVFTLDRNPGNDKLAMRMYLESQQSDPELVYETREKLLGLKTVRVKRAGVFEPRFEEYFASPKGVLKAIASTYGTNDL
jgi:hypothetical protein